MQKKQLNKSISNLCRMALLAGCSLLAACQTSGKNGVFGDAVPNETNANGQQVPANVAPGKNPYANPKLINTSNALTDYCPSVRIRAGTESFRTYKKGADKENKQNIRYQAAVTTVARECRYEGYNLSIKVGIKGRVITGPAGAPGRLIMPIRVAVVEGGETVYSKLHKHPSTLNGASSSFAFVDDKIVIHAPKKTNVRVYIGFDEGPYNTP